MMRYFDFKAVELVHIDDGKAKIVAVEASRLDYVDDIGNPRTIDLAECARIYACLRRVGQFPPAEDLDWGSLVAQTPGFADLPLPVQAVIGLRGAIDEPPWFQFLNPRRTQFEFKDYDHIKRALLEPLATATRWYSWDAY
jgi:hypothetical protein